MLIYISSKKPFYLLLEHCHFKKIIYTFIDEKVENMSQKEF